MGLLFLCWNDQKRIMRHVHNPLIEIQIDQKRFEGFGKGLAFVVWLKAIREDLRRSLLLTVGVKLINARLGEIRFGQEHGVGGVEFNVAL